MNARERARPGARRALAGAVLSCALCVGSPSARAAPLDETLELFDALCLSQRPSPELLADAAPEHGFEPAEGGEFRNPETGAHLSFVADLGAGGCLITFETDDGEGVRAALLELLEARHGERLKARRDPVFAWRLGVAPAPEAPKDGEIETGDAPSGDTEVGLGVKEADGRFQIALMTVDSRAIDALLEAARKAADQLSESFAKICVANIRDAAAAQKAFIEQGFEQSGGGLVDKRRRLRGAVGIQEGRLLCILESANADFEEAAGFGPELLSAVAPGGVLEAQPEEENAGPGPSQSWIVEAKDGVAMLLVTSNAPPGAIGGGAVFTLGFFDKPAQ